jgi:hypothetical protein
MALGGSGIGLRAVLGGAGLGLAFGGSGIGGMAARGGTGAGFGFFTTVGGARGGAFRFAVARDLGWGLVRDGTTTLAVPRRLGVGLALAGEAIFFFGLIRGLAAGITTAGGGGALARRPGPGLAAGFGAIGGAAAFRRVDRRAV